MKVALISLGCHKNLVDSEHLLGILMEDDTYELTNNIDEADIAIVNTCGFINDAKEESIDNILELAEHKKNGNLKKIIVAGCLAQKYAENLMEEIPEIDAIIGTGEIDKIKKVVKTILKDNKIIENKTFNFLADSSTSRILTTYPHTAYLKIAEGCNRKCTYCIIPELRGRLRSRKIEDIVEEARNLADSGVKEINILAQETTEYGVDIYGKRSLVDLLKELVKIKKLKWIRLYYMYPDSVDNELIELIKNEEKICNYIDLPIQHISDNILVKMARGKSNKVRNVLEKIRKEIPDAIIRTTVIVGFPGETDENFEELKEFIQEFKFDYVGVFKYSREEDTYAYSLENQIDEEIKEKRYAELVNIQSEIVENKNKQYIDKELEVIIDGVSEESEYMLEGRTRGQALEIDGKVLINDGQAERGDIVKVKIEQNFEYDLLGAIIEDEFAK